MRLNSLAVTAVAAAIVSPALAFWRLPCQGRLAVARMDPIVDVGKPSSHVHAIHGASNFALEVSVNELLASDCTSCAVVQDKSVYWTPVLYFVRPDGKADLVKQVGGTLVYYLPRGDNVKAFPKGLRILAGDPYQRSSVIGDAPKVSGETDQLKLQQHGLGFNCLNYNAKPEDSMYRHNMPDKAFLDSTCANGLRAEIFFPSCWNGKDLDSPNHRSHMAYPDFTDSGVCPPSHPVRLVSLFYETIWDTYAFRGQAGEFVWSNGDPTGFGYHGDFMDGWQGDVLQNAINTCTDLSGMVEACPVFTLQDQGKQNACTINLPQILASERYESSNGLPGGVTIQRGPGYAKAAPPPPAPPRPAPPSPPPAKLQVDPAPPPPKAEAPPPPPPPPSPTTKPLQVLAEIPEPTAPPEGVEGPIGTTTYTKDGTVYEVVIFKDEVTATVEVPAETPAINKRHAHRHAHRRHF